MQKVDLLKPLMFRGARVYWIFSDDTDSIHVGVHMGKLSQERSLGRSVASGREGGEELFSELLRAGGEGSWQGCTVKSAPGAEANSRVSAWSSDHNEDSPPSAGAEMRASLLGLEGDSEQS